MSLALGQPSQRGNLFRASRWIIYFSYNSFNCAFFASLKRKCQPASVLVFSLTAQLGIHTGGARDFFFHEKHFYWATSVIFMGLKPRGPHPRPFWNSKVFHGYVWQPRSGAQKQQYPDCCSLTGPLKEAITQNCHWFKFQRVAFEMALADGLALEHVTCNQFTWVTESKNGRLLYTAARVVDQSKVEATCAGETAPGYRTRISVWQMHSKPVGWSNASDSLSLMERREAASGMKRAALSITGAWNMQNVCTR